MIDVTEIADNLDFFINKRFKKRGLPSMFLSSKPHIFLQKCLVVILLIICLLSINLSDVFADKRSDENIMQDLINSMRDRLNDKIKRLDEHPPDTVFFFRQLNNLEVYVDAYLMRYQKQVPVTNTIWNVKDFAIDERKKAANLLNEVGKYQMAYQEVQVKAHTRILANTLAVSTVGWLGILMLPIDMYNLIITFGYGFWQNSYNFNYGGLHTDHSLNPSLKELQEANENLKKALDPNLIIKINTAKDQLKELIRYLRIIRDNARICKDISKDIVRKIQTQIEIMDGIKKRDYAGIYAEKVDAIINKVVSTLKRCDIPEAPLVFNSMQPQQITVTKIYANGNLLLANLKEEVRFTVEDPKIVSVDKSGKVLPSKSGESTIIAKIIGTNCVCMANVTVNLSAKSLPLTTDITVPDLIGMSKQDAEETLKKIGLVLKGEYVNSANVTFGPGKAISQIPAHPKLVKAGTKVIAFFNPIPPSLRKLIGLEFEHREMTFKSKLGGSWLRVYAKYSDGTDDAVINQCKWTTTDPGEKVIHHDTKNSPHHVTAVGNGWARLTAKYTEKGVAVTAYCDITVDAPELEADIDTDKTDYIVGETGTFRQNCKNTRTNTEYIWTIDDKVVGKGETLNYKFKEIGSFDMEMTVKTDYWITEQDTAYLTIWVHEKEFAADFSYSPKKDEYEVGETVKFTNTSKGLGGEVIYRWYTGTSLRFMKEVSNKRDFSFTFPGEGTYHIRLEVESELTGVVERKEITLNATEQSFLLWKNWHGGDRNRFMATLEGGGLTLYGNYYIDEERTFSGPIFMRKETGVSSYNLKVSKIENLSSTGYLVYETNSGVLKYMVLGLDSTIHYGSQKAHAQPVVKDSGTIELYNYIPRSYQMELIKVPWTMTSEKTMAHITWEKKQGNQIETWEGSLEKYKTGIYDKKRIDVRKATEKETGTIGEQKKPDGDFTFSVAPMEAFNYIMVRIYIENMKRDHKYKMTTRAGGREVFCTSWDQSDWSKEGQTYGETDFFVEETFPKPLNSSYVLKVTEYDEKGRPTGVPVSKTLNLADFVTPDVEIEEEPVTELKDKPIPIEVLNRGISINVTPKGAYYTGKWISFQAVVGSLGLNVKSNYEWDINGRSFENNQTVSHMFTKPGTYSAGVKVDAYDRINKREIIVGEGRITIVVKDDPGREHIGLSFRYEPEGDIYANTWTEEIITLTDGNKYISKVYKKQSEVTFSVNNSDQNNLMYAWEISRQDGSYLKNGYESSFGYSFDHPGQYTIKFSSKRKNENAYLDSIEETITVLDPKTKKSVTEKKPFSGPEKQELKEDKQELLELDANLAEFTGPDTVEFGQTVIFTLVQHNPDNIYVFKINPPGKRSFSTTRETFSLSVSNEKGFSLGSNIIHMKVTDKKTGKTHTFEMKVFAKKSTAKTTPKIEEQPYGVNMAEFEGPGKVEIYKPAVFRIKTYNTDFRYVWTLGVTGTLVGLAETQGCTFLKPSLIDTTQTIILVASNMKTGKKYEYKKTVYITGSKSLQPEGGGHTLIPAEQIKQADPVYGPNCYLYQGSMLQACGQSDSISKPKISKLMLYENGRPLGPAHSNHMSIGKTGKGQFSHWTYYLLFSSSDNSDPGTNGRKYSFTCVDKSEEIEKKLLSETETNLAEFTGPDTVKINSVGVFTIIDFIPDQRYTWSIDGKGAVQSGKQLHLIFDSEKFDPGPKVVQLQTQDKKTGKIFRFEKSVQVVKSLYKKLGTTKHKDKKLPDWLREKILSKKKPVKADDIKNLLADGRAVEANKIIESLANEEAERILSELTSEEVGKLLDVDLSKEFEEIEEESAIILEDNFDDGILDRTKWTHIGVGKKMPWTDKQGASVKEAGGVLTISEDQVDAGGAVKSLPFTVKRGDVLKLTRKVRIFPRDNFRNTNAFITKKGKPVAQYRYFYKYKDFADGVYFTDGGKERVILPWGKWFTEIVTYNTRTGETTYSIPGRGKISHTFGTLPVSTFQLLFDAYGWNIGHKVEINYMKLQKIE